MDGTIPYCTKYSQIYKKPACKNAITMIQMINEFQWTKEELELIISICNEKLKKFRISEVSPSFSKGGWCNAKE